MGQSLDAKEAWTVGVDIAVAERIIKRGTDHRMNLLVVKNDPRRNFIHESSG